jgi:hypothetical protein
MTTRALFHDVRGVLAAASSNVEFARARAEGELQPVLEEVEHELRLVSDVIALTGSSDEERVVEVDLRALLFVVRDTRPFAIDATQPPFIIAGTRSALASFAESVIAATHRGGVDVSRNACSVRGIDAALAERLVCPDERVCSTVEGGSLILRRKD